MKKYVSFILMICLLCQIFSVSVMSAETTQPDYVAAMIKRGIIPSAAGLKKPITREYAALYLAQIMTGITKTSEWLTYTGESEAEPDDLAAAAYKGAVMYVIDKKIINAAAGTDGKKYFVPNNTITYSDAQVIILRAMGFSDLAYPWGSIEKAGQLGIEASDSSGIQDYVTAGQFLEMLYKAFPTETAVKMTTAKLSGYAFDIGYSTEGVIFIKWGDSGYTMESLINEIEFEESGSGVKEKYYSYKELIPPKEFKGGDIEIIAFGDKITHFRIQNQEVTSLDISKLTSLKNFSAANNKLTDISVPENITDVIQFDVKGNSLNYSKLPVNIKADYGKFMTDEAAADLISSLNKMRASVVLAEDYTSALYNTANISLNFKIAKEAEKNVKKGIVDAIAKAVSEKIEDESTVGIYYDISLTKTVAKTSAQVAKTSAAVKVTVNLDDSVKGYDTYYAAVSDGETSNVIKGEYNEENNTLTFETNMFAMTAVVCCKNPEPEEEPEYVMTFTDVKETDWSYEYVKKVASLGIMSEVSKDKFDPSGKMTRGMFVSALAKAAGVDGNGVTWAIDNAILLGDGNGNYTLDESLTREQMAVMFKRYFDKSGIAPDTTKAMVDKFADAESVSAWAVEAVELMRVTGLITGKENKMFDPQGTFTRAEAATVIYRLLNIIE